MEVRYSGLDQDTIDLIKVHQDNLVSILEKELSKFEYVDVQEITFLQPTRDRRSYDDYEEIASLKLSDACGLSVVIRDAIGTNRRYVGFTRVVGPKLHSFIEKVRDTVDPVNRDEVIEDTVASMYKWLDRDDISQYFELYKLDVDLAETRLRKYLNSLSDKMLRSIGDDVRSNSVVKNCYFLVKNVGTLYFRCTKGSVPLFDYRSDAPDVSYKDRKAAKDIRHNGYSRSWRSEKEAHKF